jgi:hypothetical protein
VAVFTGAPFRDVWGFIAKRKRGNWKGRTYHHDQRDALKQFNKGRTVSVKVTNRKSLSRFAREDARPGVVYMIRTTGHQQVLKDGIVVDQGGSVPIEKYWGRRKRVVHFWAKAV